MSNPIFNMLNPMPGGMGNMMQMISQLNDFKKTVKGNPKDQVQELLKTGRMSQADFERFSQMATQIQNMFK